MITNNNFIFKLLLLLFSFINIINSQYATTSTTLTVKELYYNNNSLVFYSYPSSTDTNICVFNIPFQISSSTFTVSYVFSVGTGLLTYGEGNNKAVTYQHQFAENNQLTVILYVTENGIQNSFQFTLISIGIDYKNINQQVSDIGIFYNSLSFKAKFDLLPPNYNISFNYDTTPNVRQYYLGNNEYLFQFQQNYKSFFTPDPDTGNITVSFKYYGGSDHVISLKSPFQNSNSKFSSEIFPLTLSDTIYCVIRLTSPINYFAAMTIGNIYYNEPYLISNQNGYYNYLSPGSSDTLYPSTYYIFLYQNSTARPILSNDPQYTIKTIEFPNFAIIKYKNPIFEIPTSGFTVINSKNPYTLEFGEPFVLFRYPYGLTNASSGIASLSLSYSVPPYRVATMKVPVRVNGGPINTVDLPNDPVIDPDIPVITNYTIQFIPNGKMILYFNITNESVIQSISIYSTSTSIYKTFPYYQLKPYNIKNINNYKFAQIIIPRISINKFIIKTKSESTLLYYVNSNSKYILEGQYKSLQSVETLDTIQLSDYNFKTGLKSVSFLYNDLKVTNNGISNKMYLKLSNYMVSREVKVTFIYSDYKTNEMKDTVYSIYNSLTDQFEFEFNVPKNIKTGQVSYKITIDSLDNLNYYSYLLPSEFQLRVNESKNIDLYGPVVLNINSNINQDNINYIFEISDSSNGFKSGYILFRGDADMAERNISITPLNLYAGTIYKGVYSVNLLIDYPVCTTQVFTIVYAYFEDTEGYYTEYDILKPSKKSPFYLLSTFKQQNVQYVCTQPSSSEGKSIYPQLVSIDFIVGQLSMKSKESERTAYYTYTTYHPDGISSTNLPKFYVSRINNEIYESVYTNITSSNSTHTVFMSRIIFPFIFDPNFSFQISVYGIVSNAGTTNGFSSIDLNNKGIPPTYSLPYSNLDSPQPIITGSSKLSSTSFGGLWIYGISLELAAVYQIQYTEDDSGYKQINPDIVYSNALYFSSIRPTNKPINIVIGVSQQNLGDPFTITPVIFNFDNNNNNSSSSCKGTPLCGGSLQGQCIIDSGCKCISPWFGEDCMSRIIQVPPPLINETNPNTNITNGNEETAKFSSIVSIVGIKELGIDSTPVNVHYFDEWNYSFLVNDSYINRYSYSSVIIKDKKNVSNITVILDWYKVESTIQFAGEELHLNPSTIKYTIKIDSYPFSSSLNTLQLIIKASIETNTSNPCNSNSEYGEIINQDSDYIKLQVDKFSFYGRFIKRCQIDDNKITKLTNTLLDSTMNQIINNNQISQSYIGINIPQFKNNVIIDPDFSVLLDSNPINPDSCNDGLTTPQLIGIIIGSVAFFIILIIIIGIIIYKSPGCISIKVLFYKLFKKSK